MINYNNILIIIYNKLYTINWTCPLVQWRYTSLWSWLIKNLENLWNSGLISWFFLSPLHRDRRCLLPQSDYLYIRSRLPAGVAPGSGLTINWVQTVHLRRDPISAWCATMSVCTEMPDWLLRLISQHFPLSSPTRRRFLPISRRFKAPFEIRFLSAA